MPTKASTTRSRTANSVITVLCTVGSGEVAVRGFSKSSLVKRGKKGENGKQELTIYFRNLTYFTL